MPDKLYGLSSQAQISLVDIGLREESSMVDFEPNPTASLYQFSHQPLQRSQTLSDKDDIIGVEKMSQLTEIETDVVPIKLTEDVFEYCVEVVEKARILDKLRA